MKKLAEKIKKFIGTGMLISIPSIAPNAGYSSLGPKTLINNIINFALYFVGVIALVFVVWGGVQFVLSGGDEGKVAKARKTLLYAVVGIIVVVLAYTLINWGLQAPNIVR